MGEAATATAVVVVEDQAHLGFGHFPTLAADLARAFAAEGHPTELLTAIGLAPDGWARPGIGGDPPAGGVPVRRYRPLARPTALVARALAAVGRRQPRLDRPLGVAHRSVRGLALAVEANAARRRLEAEHGAAVVVSTCNGLTAVVPGLAAEGRWVLHQHYAPPRRRGLLAGAALRAVERRRRHHGGRVVVAVPAADWIERWGRAAPGLDVVQLPMTGAEPEPIPMAEARARLGLPAEGPIVACLGGFDPSKDIATLVEAGRRAHAAAGPGAPLVVLAGGVVDMVPDHLRHQPPPWLVLRPGHYPEAERLLLPAAADAVVWSFRPRHRRASATLTDALSVGTPVLASAPSRVAQEVEAHDVGLTFPASDPDALAGRLLDVAAGHLPARAQVLEAAAGPLSRRAAARAHLAVLDASPAEA